LVVLAEAEKGVDGLDGSSIQSYFPFALALHRSNTFHQLVKNPALRHTH
jgi:hypothetical protein